MMTRISGSTASDGASDRIQISADLASPVNHCSNMPVVRSPSVLSSGSETSQLMAAAGSIVDGRGLAAALAFGAQGIWMGTRFIASTEANAHELYKKRIAEIGSDDTLARISVSKCWMRASVRTCG